MATVTELLEGRTRSVDAYNQRTGSRRFFVDVRDPAAAVAEVVAAHGGANSPFPGDNGLIVDDIGHSQDSSGAGSVVTYSYSNNRRFTKPDTIDKSKPDYYTWSENFNTKTTLVPYARQVPRLVPPTPTPVQVWEIGDADSIPESEQRVEVSVTLTAWGPDETETVNAQIGALHQINGAWYLFEGASINRVSDTQYDVTYNYRGDSGTTARPSDDPKFARPTMNRLPWYSYTVLPPLDPIEEPPTFDIEPLWYRFDANGANSLPGWPF